MSYYEVSFHSERFLLKQSTVYFVLGCVTVVVLSRKLGSALCIFGHAKRGVKHISHAVLTVSPKQNGESLNQFYILCGMGNNLKLKTFF